SYGAAGKTFCTIWPAVRRPSSSMLRRVASPSPQSTRSRPPLTPPRQPALHSNEEEA
ncbi:hypothetical protein MNEG_2404, partial [Monoraphidium neglectum]